MQNRKEMMCQMSERPKSKKRNEERYYEPIRKCLNMVMAQYRNQENISQNRFSEDMPK
jgi:hypothetical protein